MTEKTIKEHLSVKETWIRLVFMIFFVLVTCITRLLIWIIAAFQFIYTLFTGTAQKSVLTFSDSLCQYIYQIYNFLTYLSETKPFPFEAWPTAKHKPSTKKLEKGEKSE